MQTPKSPKTNIKINDPSEDPASHGKTCKFHQTHKTRPKFTKKQIIFLVGITICVIISIIAAIVGTILDSAEPAPESGNETSEVVAEEAPVKEETEEVSATITEEAAEEEGTKVEVAEAEEVASDPEPDPTPVVHTGVCPADFGNLMLINPNFTVTTSWIALRSTQLVNITELYGIEEGNVYNGSPLMEPEAASHLNDMLTAYTRETGGTMTTRAVVFVAEARVVADCATRRARATTTPASLATS